MLQEHGVSAHPLFEPRVLQEHGVVLGEFNIMAEIAQRGPITAT